MPLASGTTKDENTADIHSEPWTAYLFQGRLDSESSRGWCGWILRQRRTPRNDSYGYFPGNEITERNTLAVQAQLILEHSDLQAHRQVRFAHR